LNDIILKKNEVSKDTIKETYLTNSTGPVIMPSTKYPKSSATKNQLKKILKSRCKE
jgi:RAB protein geranylgeranyltransferase component A